MVDLKYLERRNKGFCVIPGADASNKDNGTYLPPNGSVMKVHIFGGKFLLPTKVFCCLRSKSNLKSECSITHLSILACTTSAAQ